ncbi:hypothetical protein FF2_000141 [Malus domestica]
MLLRFLRKQSCWGSGSRDSGSSVSSIFEKVIMLGVWLSRFGGRCLFDFGVSNLVGSVFSDVSKGWACLLVYLAPKHGGWHTGTFQLSSSERCSGSCKLHVLNFGRDFGKVICEVFDRMPIISAKLSVRVTGADKAKKVGASSISEIGPRGL